MYDGKNLIQLIYSCCFLHIFYNQLSLNPSPVTVFLGAGKTWGGWVWGGGGGGEGVKFPCKILQNSYNLYSCRSILIFYNFLSLLLLPYYMGSDKHGKPGKPGKTG